MRPLDPLLLTNRVGAFHALYRWIGVHSQLGHSTDG